MANQNTAPQGSSLVDLMVGCLCLALFASLAMPTMLMMRSQARLDNCGEKMRNICLAAHNFHDSWKRLPPSVLGSQKIVDSEKWAEDENYKDYWKNFQYTSSAAMMLPYMDKGRLYDQLPPIAYDMYNDFRDYTDSSGNRIYAWHGGYGKAEAVMVEVVDEFLCPEDDLKDQELPAVTATQPCEPIDASVMEMVDGCRDIVTLLWHDKDKQLGLTNYAPCIGVVGQAWKEGDAEMNRWRGALSPTRVKVKLEDISDGTSRTIMYGETLGEINDGERTMAVSWLWGGGARITGHVPFGENNHPEYMNVNMLGDEKNSSVVGFGSKHDGVLYFALCDGSCNKISTDIDREILYQLAGGFDGGTPEDFISD